MSKSRISKYGPWLLAPLIGAAAMLAFLHFRDSSGETFEPPAAVGEQGEPVPAEKIQEARDFKEFPLYWLGESFESLPLTKIVWFTPERGFPTQDVVDFAYGTCTPPPEGGCSPPLVIQVEPVCWRLPETISGVKLDDVFDFRGAKAVWLDGHLRIWTGDSEIAVFAQSQDVMLKAGNEITPLGNVNVPLIDSNLPPPNFDKCPQPSIMTPVVETLPEQQ